MHWLVPIFAVIGGCAMLTEQGVYEGIRQQQQMRPDKTMPDTQRLPDYDKFKQEREKLTPQAQ
jgi:hypothetical protein